MFISNREQGQLTNLIVGLLHAPSAKERERLIKAIEELNGPMDEKVKEVANIVMGAMEWAKFKP